MASGEVWSFDEAYLKKVGTAAGGTTEYAVDTFAESISVAKSRELVEMVDTSGVVVKRVPIRTSVSVSLGALYNAPVNFFDGNDVKLYFQNALGTETWYIGSCTSSDESWDMSADGLVAYQVELVGNSFGTV